MILIDARARAHALAATEVSDLGRAVTAAVDAAMDATYADDAYAEAVATRAAREVIVERVDALEKAFSVAAEKAAVVADLANAIRANIVMRLPTGH